MGNTEQPTKVGYVYIMTNPKMPGLVKIGSGKLPPEERARQLFTTGVPTPFQVIAFHEFEDELRAERELQAIFSRQRVHSRREFFEITVEEARTALLCLSDGKPHEPSAAPLPENNALTREGEKKPMSNTNASVLGFPYWTRFNEMRAEQKLVPRFENAGPRFFHRYFLVNPSKRNGKRNIHYEGRIRINTPQVSMRLIFKTADNIKELFDLIARDRDRIEQEIGFPLLWVRDRGRYESHIAVERDNMDPRDSGQWNGQHTWLSEVVSAFERVIRPRVAKLP
jgi:T5orf172 domain/Domain of unknown function (DUF4268)